MSPIEAREPDLASEILRSDVGGGFDADAVEALAAFLEAPQPYSNDFEWVHLRCKLIPRPQSITPKRRDARPVAVRFA
jgi:hypothetical protein